MLITAVHGRVGSIQRLYAINAEFKEFTTYGNWVEESPAYKVTGSGNEWEGAVVKIKGVGKEYHTVVAVDDNSRSTNIKREFLIPIADAQCSNSEVVPEKEQNQPILTAGFVVSSALNRLTPEVLELEAFVCPEEIAFQEWGLSLGDIVQWEDSEHSAMMAGRIYDVASDYALVDCGSLIPVAVNYPQLKKITSSLIESALDDGRSPHSHILQRAKNVKALWDVNSLQAQACLKELLKMSWHYKVWIDIDAMESENRLLFIPGGIDYLTPEVVISESIPTNPAEEIAKVFRSATDWASVRIALLTYGYEHKQAAWNLLFEQEKQRFLALMPLAVQKLSKLKKQGRIIDFREDVTGEHFFIKLKSGTEQEVSLVQLDEFVLELGF